MSLVSQLKPVLPKIPNLRLPGGNLHMSIPQKVTVLSVTVGVLVIGFLARYLRRRRRVVNPENLQRLERRGLRPSRGIKSPNGDVLGGGGGRRSASPGGRSLQRQASLMSSDRMSVASGALSHGGVVTGLIGGAPTLLPGAGDAAVLSPQQLGLMARRSVARSKATEWTCAAGSAGGECGDHHLVTASPLRRSSCLHPHWAQRRIPTLATKRLRRHFSLVEAVLPVWEVHHPPINLTY